MNVGAPSLRPIRLESPLLCLAHASNFDIHAPPQLHQLTGFCISTSCHHRDACPSWTTMPSGSRARKPLSRLRWSLLNTRGSVSRLSSSSLPRPMHNLLAFQILLQSSFQILTQAFLWGRCSFRSVPCSYLLWSHRLL